MNRKKVTLIALVGVVGLAFVGGNIMANGPIGSASATHNCNTVDAAVYGFTFGYVNGDKCTNNHVDHAVQEVREAEANQTKVDIYSALLGQKARSQSFNAVFSNYVNDTRTVAWSKAEVAIAEAWENNSTKAEAKVAAKEAISDYYAIHQINLIEDYSTVTTANNYMMARAEIESYINQPLFADSDGLGPNTGFIYFDGNFDTCSSCTWPKLVSYNNVNVTLVNNSQHEVVQGPTFRTWNANTPGFTGGTQTITPATDISSGDNTTVAITTEYGPYELRDFQVSAPNDNYTPEQVIIFKNYSNKWHRIETINTELQSESDAFVDAIWQDLEDGNISTSDVISRNTLMFEYGTDAASGNGSYYDIIGATSQMGIDAPDLNGTGQMEITMGGNAYQGMLFGNAPNGTWEVGTTYNPNNIPGPVLFASIDGQLIEVDRNFTVANATSKDGESMQTVTTIEYNYQTSNASQLNEKYNQLLDLTQEIEDRQDNVTGGATGSSGGLVDWVFGSTYGVPNAVIVFVGLAMLSVIGGRGN